MYIKHLKYHKGRLSLYPYRVFSEDGKIVRAFSTRLEAEKWLKEMVDPNSKTAILRT